LENKVKKSREFKKCCLKIGLITVHGKIVTHEKHDTGRVECCSPREVRFRREGKC
jgi:hypothetical protein